MQVLWTTEQALGLAPDKYSIKTSRGIAVPEKWLSLGRQPCLAWGSFPIKDKPPFHTVIQLNELTFSCNCTSRKRPCNHSLGLLLLLIERPDAFVQIKVPQWAAHQTSLPFNQAANKPGLTLKSQPDPDNDSFQKRQAAILAGLQAFELWLHDMVRNGLAAVQNKPKSYWTTMADRLVDAQAGELARELRALIDLPGSHDTWPDTLLRKISRYYLLIQGFKQIDRLPPETQADLRAAVGWYPKADTAEPDTTLHDCWHVVGKQTEAVGKQRLQRTWLWGQGSNRAALLTHIAYAKQPPDCSLVTGTAVDAALIFYPSATPLRAQIVKRDQITQPQQALSGFQSIKAAQASYTQAIAANPWLRHYPMLLQGMAADYQQQRWLIQDQAGYLLPLPKKFEYGWQLRALSYAQSLCLFGEWDGDLFHPLSVWRNNRWLELHILRGVR